MRRLCSVLLCLPLLGLAGCAAFTEPMGMKDPFAIQQPFQGVARNDRILSVVTQAPAIVVRPIYGLGAENAEALRKRVLTVLRTHDVPAIAESSASIAWVLQGQAAFIRREDGRSAGQLSGTIAWQLTDAKGDERARFSTPISGDESTISDSLFGPMADQIAAQVDLVLAGPGSQVAEASPAPAEVPRASVAQVTGAPGDGNTALTKALVALLPLKGIKVADKKEKPAWRIEGKVKVEAKSPAEDLVTLRWRVLDAVGKELGTISQQNAVPHRRLDAKWGEIAAFAAEAAAEGISQLIHSFTPTAPATAAVAPQPTAPVTAPVPLPPAAPATAAAPPVQPPPPTLRKSVD
jgi:hypothetical protein